MLERRRLGPTALDISTIGLGTSAIGGPRWGDGWGSQDDNESLATIERAIGLGINWIDTAPIYGLGHAEAVVGRALHRMPASQRPHVFTKCGLLWDESQPFAPGRRILRADTIRRELDESLRRLGLDYLDLYQIHYPSAEEGSVVEDAWGEMSSLVESGKVRYIGVSNFDVFLLQRCESIRHVDSLQPPFSLIHRQAAAQLLPWCSEHETGVIVYRALQSGLLTDGFTTERIDRMDTEDWRRRDPDFQAPKLAINLTVRDSLRPIAMRHGVTTAAVAIAWTLAWPAVTGAIVGARSPAQIADWVTAGSVQLQRDDLDEIDGSLSALLPNEGPVEPITVTNGQFS